MPQTTLSRIAQLSARPLPGLVWAMRADASGHASDVPAGSPIEADAEGWHWLHFGLADNRTQALLQQLQVKSIADFIKAGEEIQQFHIEDGVLYGTIADLQRDIDGSQDDTGFMHFIMMENLLITLRRTSLNGAGLARQFLQRGVRTPTVADLLETIIEQIIEGYDRRLEIIGDEVDVLEDRIIAGIVTNARARLGASRRSIVRMHRQVVGLRTVLQRLSRDPGRTAAVPALSGLCARILHNSEQLDHELTVLRERTRLLQEEVAALLAEETNKHLRVLSILTIFFMPPTFIGGLFGMNLKGIPFSDSPYGFLSAFLLSVAATIIVAWLLRKTGILGRRGFF